MGHERGHGYAYADLSVGMAFRSPGRTITDADLVAFAGLTGDYSELHTSDVCAPTSARARTGELRDTAIAFLGIGDWRFVAPIFVGDTIFVDYRIAELRDSRSNPSQAIATFDVDVVKQDGSIVQRGRKALLLSKVPLAAVAASGGPPCRERSP